MSKSDDAEEVSGVRITFAERDHIDERALDMHMVSFEIECDRLNDASNKPEFVKLVNNDTRHPVISLKHRAGCPVELSNDMSMSETRTPQNWWFTGTFLIIMGFITATRGRD